MFNLAQQPQSIWRILCDGSRLFKASIAKVWPWQFLLLLPILLLALPAFNQKPSADTVTQAAHIPATISSTTQIMLIVVLLLTALLPLFSYCYSIHRIYSVAVHASSTAAASLKVALKKFLPVLGASIIVLIIICLVGLIALLFIIPSLKGLTELDMTKIASESLIFAIPFVLLAIFISLFFSFFMQLIIIDNCKVFKAIKQSCRLVWGKWWRNFAVILALVIVGSAVSSILSLFINSSMPVWLGLLVQIIGLSIIYPWYFSVLQVQFNDLKLRWQQKHSAPINPI